jgi:invasion protein IalB
MINNAKQAAFIIIGLAVVSAAFLISRSHNVQAAKKEGTKFDDWVVSCAPKEDKEGSKENSSEQTCLLTQQINAQTEKDKDQQVLAVYQIGYFGKEKALKMIQILPLGVSLEAGTSIVSSKNLIAAGKFTICTQAGCHAVANISDEDLKTILSNKENSVAFMNMEGKQINLPFSTKGLQSGLDYLK